MSSVLSMKVPEKGWSKIHSIFEKSHILPGSLGIHFLDIQPDRILEMSVVVYSSSVNVGRAVIAWQCLLCFGWLVYFLSDR